MLAVLFIFIQLCISKQISAWTNQELPWPIPIHGAINGYDENTNSIWLVSPSGNNDGRALLRYSLERHEWTTYVYPMSNYFREPATNAFSAINDTIYFIQSDLSSPIDDPSKYCVNTRSCFGDVDVIGDVYSYLRGFNMSNHQWSSFEYQLKYVYTNHGPCLTKSFDKEYLIMVGGEYFIGKNSDDWILSNKYKISNKTVFYNIKSNSFTDGPELSGSIRDCGCTVASDGYLYIIGGVYDGERSTNIWRLNVNDIVGIQQDEDKYNWNKIENTDFRYAPQYATTLLLGDSIYIVGGKTNIGQVGPGFYMANVDDHCFGNIHYLNITDGKIYTDGFWDCQDNVYHCGLMVHSKIYLFGGYRWSFANMLSDDEETETEENREENRGYTQLIWNSISIYFC